MKDLLQQFLLIAVIIYSLHMIYYYFKGKSKKLRNVPTIEMNFLMRIYRIDIIKLGINTVKKHISLINSVIISTDLLIYYNVENVYLKLFIVFIVTFLLVLIFYSILIIPKKLFKINQNVL